MSKRLIALALVLGMMAAACSPNADGEGTTPPTGDPTLDTDGDGLDDAREVAAGTSPELADTDGDGYSDFAELVDLSFDPGANPFRFNPAVADIPEIDIQLVSPPIIEVICTAGTGNTTSFSNSRSDSTSSTVSTTSSGSESQALAFGVTVGSEVEGSAAGIKGKISYSASASETNTSTVGWSSTQSSTNSSTLSSSQSYAETNNETCTGGVISVSVAIENRGHIAFTLKDVVLSAFMTRVSNPGQLDPVGNLVFDTADQIKEFPDTTLGPGASISQLTFKNDSLDLASVTALLADSRNLTIEVATAEVADATGAAFAHSATTILANTATVLIDYGLDREAERYQVATNQIVGTRGITLGAALRDDLRLGDEIEVGTTPWDFDGDGATEGSTESAISRVRSVANDGSRNGYWVLAVTADRGAGPDSVLYSPLDAGYDPDDIELRAGDVAHLAYISDADRDGVDTRTEFLHGSDPDDADSDDDGLSDGVELRGWTIDINGSPFSVYSSPTVVDTDGDGVSDADEFAAGTNPSLPGQPSIASLIVAGSGRTVTVDALGLDLDGTVDQIVIDWGDGTPPTVEPGTAAQGVSHMYAADGRYVLVVSAVDDDGFTTADPPMVDLVVPIGLAARWAFDGSTDDTGSGNYDATFWLDAGYGENRDGVAGTAVNMVGGSELVPVLFDKRFRTYPVIVAPHVPVSGELTISGWFQHFNPRGNPSRMAGQGNWLNLFIDDGRVNFGVLDERIPDANLTVTDPELYTGAWTHFAGVVERDDDGSALVLYRDGVEVARRNLPGVFLENPGSCLFYVGSGLNDVRLDAVATSADQQDLLPLPPSELSECDTPYAGQLYPGFIDDVRVYEIALDADSVAALYADGP